MAKLNLCWQEILKLLKAKFNQRCRSRGADYDHHITTVPPPPFLYTLVEGRRRGFPNSYLLIFCCPSKNTQEIIKCRNRPQLSTVICVHMYLGDTRERRGLAPPKRRATHTWMDIRILFINSKIR